MGNKKSKNYVQIDQQNIDADNTTTCFDIVWLDERSREALLQDQYYAEQILYLKTYNLCFFEEIFECADYLYKLPASANVLLLVQDQWADDIVRFTHCLCPIKYIFVVHPIASSTDHPNNLSPEYVKVKHVNLEQVVDQIRYYEARFICIIKELFSIDIFNASQKLEFSSTEINGRFLFNQLLLDILLRMEPKLNDKDELIARCTELYASDPTELKKVERFHRDYKREKVFEWYSEDAFVFRLLNQAFRTLNIHLLFLFRFFMQDLQSQLILYQEQSRVRVYRGQKLSNEEWQRLSNAKGQYISMSSFISTSLQQNIAAVFISVADNNVSESNTVRVLFQIEADPHLPGGVKPFARLARSRGSCGEDEILFMAGSLFKILDVVYGEPFSTVKMELCSNEENTLKTLFESLRSEYGGKEAGEDNEASLNSFGIILYNMDNFDMAGRFFRRIYFETTNDDPNRARYCQNIGNVASNTGQYEESIRWYEQALKIYESNGIIGRPSLANLHLVRGNVYSKMKNRRQALDSYDKALTIYRANFGENYPKVALCYCNMSLLFKRRNYYRTSLEYCEKALRIAESTLPVRHPDLIHYHLRLATLLLDLRHRELQRALIHTEAALRIANAVLPPDNPMFLSIFEMLGYIYQLMRDFEQSTVWYQKVDHLGGLQSADVRIERVLMRRKNFTCTRCHRRTWIHRSFEWMKDTWLNCLVFHDFGFFLLDIVRYSCHY